ncbi:MAG: type II toxin-antitoxin system RelE/ParE family toxin [Bacteroidota bacterium]
MIRPLARTQLSDIWLEIGDLNPEAADRLIERFGAAFELKAQFPFSGQEQPGNPPGLRRLIVDPYLAFYLPIEDGIEVIRIFHGKRDIDGLL